MTRVGWPELGSLGGNPHAFEAEVDLYPDIPRHVFKFAGQFVLVLGADVDRDDTWRCGAIRHYSQQLFPEAARGEVSGGLGQFMQTVGEGDIYEKHAGLEGVVEK